MDDYINLATNEHKFMGPNFFPTNYYSEPYVYTIHELDSCKPPGDYSQCDNLNFSGLIESKV